MEEVYHVSGAGYSLILEILAVRDGAVSLCLDTVGVWFVLEVGVLGSGIAMVHGYSWVRLVRVGMADDIEIYFLFGGLRSHGANHRFSCGVQFTGGAGLSHFLRIATINFIMVEVWLSSYGSSI